PRREHERHIVLDRRLYRERTIRQGTPPGQRQPHFQPEQRDCPRGGVRLEGACLPHHVPSGLHRHPTHLPTRCRFHVTPGGGELYRYLTVVLQVPYVHIG